jgi:alpha-soluble NSF attachment protein|tara:strand:- start:1868 stop:2683 length:816 start_codon:yes stop_codon:yes gene_type:complete
MAMFSSSSKYEEAAELLEKACNNYKLAKMWREAADGFALLADCHDKSDSKHDAATAHVDAANALKKIDVDAAVASLRVAVSMFQDMGRLSISAKHLKDIGETFEKADKLEGALDAYTQAADIYAAEESSSTANSCKLKVAEIAAVLERYPLAVECYEEVAKASMDNNLLRFSVKGYLLCAGITRLCYQEPHGVKNAMERYEDIDPSFGGSREHKLLGDLASAAEEGDADAFTGALAEYDSMSRLDPWKTKMLLRAKKHMAKAIEEEEDDLT